MGQPTLALHREQETVSDMRRCTIWALAQRSLTSANGMVRPCSCPVSTAKSAREDYDRRILPLLRQLRAS
jgi:hypothetical protein